jgi:hypothetical protein
MSIFPEAMQNPAARQAVRQFKNIVVCHSEFISESRIFKSIAFTADPETSSG